VTIPVATNELEQDFVKLNEAPVITSVTRDPAGLIDNNASVALAITFVDPENEAVTVTWAADSQYCIR